MSICEPQAASAPAHRTPSRQPPGEDICCPGRGCWITLTRMNKLFMRLPPTLGSARTANTINSRPRSVPGDIIIRLLGFQSERHRAALGRMLQDGWAGFVEPQAWGSGGGRGKGDPSVEQPGCRECRGS